MPTRGCQEGQSSTKVNVSIHPSIYPSQPHHSLLPSTEYSPDIKQENAEPSKLFSWEPDHQAYFPMSVASSGILALQAQNMDPVQLRTESRSTLGKLPNGLLKVSSSPKDSFDYTTSSSPDVTPSLRGDEKIDPALSLDEDQLVAEGMTEPVDMHRDRLYSIIEPEEVDDIKMHPFRRWVNTLHRRNVDRRGSHQSREESWSLEDTNETPNHDLTSTSWNGSTTHKHKQFISSPSSALVTAIKSTRMSFSTTSPVGHSISRRKSLVRGSIRSSRQSRSFNRVSTDGSSVSTRIIDEASKGRAIKRRQTIEELVSTEESYVADLKALVNVQFLVGLIVN